MASLTRLVVGRVAPRTRMCQGYSVFRRSINFSCHVQSRFISRRNNNFNTVDKHLFCQESFFGYQCGDNMLIKLNCRRHFFKNTVNTAGHNKWSKVKHVKGPKDAARAMEISKLQPKVKYAVQTGGSDVTNNAILASLLEYAHARGIPRSSIESMIKSAAGSKAAPSTSILCEVRGPAGSCLLVDVLSDNTNRTRTELKTLLRKLGCSLAEQGSALYAFSHKGVIRVPQSSILVDEVLDVAIEAGAEDVMETEYENEEQVWMFMCEPKELRSVCNSLKSLNYKPISVSLEYIAENTVILKDSELENAAHIISQLSDHPDVVKVYDNITSES
ncbi:putative transcriptional regulatory protein Amuc_0709 [Saccoglossus kowalevskii]|uniref:Translational activator of cytochrome c oxidase 1-like n=1 Tax=Saccoglossus kowalevskii TaxID=10224 RepID=A0ABM0GWZ9_SACKO|nr:PREDICTED: translational activator of cytochrome c oxidase 1-like [Saccoglossus kowalevskii]